MFISEHNKLLTNTPHYIHDNNFIIGYMPTMANIYNKMVFKTPALPDGRWYYGKLKVLRYNYDEPMLIGWHGYDRCHDISVREVTIETSGSITGNSNDAYDAYANIGVNTGVRLLIKPTSLQAVKQIILRTPISGNRVNTINAYYTTNISKPSVSYGNTSGLTSLLLNISISNTSEAFTIDLPIKITPTYVCIDIVNAGSNAPLCCQLIGDDMAYGKGYPLFKYKDGILTPPVAKDGITPLFTNTLTQGIIVDSPNTVLTFAINPSSKLLRFGFGTAIREYDFNIPTDGSTEHMGAYPYPNYNMYMLTIAMAYKTVYPIMQVLTSTTAGSLGMGLEKYIFDIPTNYIASEADNNAQLIDITEYIYNYTYEASINTSQLDSQLSTLDNMYNDIYHTLPMSINYNYTIEYAITEVPITSLLTELSAYNTELSEVYTNVMFINDIYHASDSILDTIINDSVNIGSSSTDISVLSNTFLSMVINIMNINNTYTSLKADIDTLPIMYNISYFNGIGLTNILSSIHAFNIPELTTTQVNNNMSALLNYTDVSICQSIDLAGYYYNDLLDVYTMHNRIDALQNNIDSIALSYDIPVIDLINHNQYIVDNNDLISRQHALHVSANDIVDDLDNIYTFYNEVDTLLDASYTQLVNISTVSYPILNQSIHATSSNLMLLNNRLLSIESINDIPMLTMTVNDLYKVTNTELTTFLKKIDTLIYYIDKKNE